MSTAEFTDLLLTNSGTLQPFAVSLTHDRESAKDLLQETLYRAFANKDKYNTGTNVKAWLFTIMRNIFINDYRKKTKQRIIFNGPGDDSILNLINNTVYNEGQNSLQLKEIQNAIYHLPGIFKVPFLLYFEGYRYQEISHMLKEPLGTVKSRIHFARKLLRAQLNRN